MMNENAVYPKKNFAVLKCCVRAARLIAAIIIRAQKLSKRLSSKGRISSKGLNKRTLEDTGGESISKYRPVLDEAVNLKATKCGFKTSNNLVELYERTKKSLIYFYPKREVLKDGIHTKPLSL